VPTDRESYDSRGENSYFAAGTATQGEGPIGPRGRARAVSGRRVGALAGSMRAMPRATAATR
jgi:hypothetical protein